jgi:hypothetical protein
MEGLFDIGTYFNRLESEKTSTDGGVVPEEEKREGGRAVSLITWFKFAYLRIFEKKRAVVVLLDL